MLCLQSACFYIFAPFLVEKVLYQTCRLLRALLASSVQRVLCAVLQMNNEDEPEYATAPEDLEALGGHAFMPGDDVHAMHAREQFLDAYGDPVGMHAGGECGVRASSALVWLLWRLFCAT